MNSTTGRRNAFLDDNVDRDGDIVDKRGNQTREIDLFSNLSEDITITSLDQAKEVFLDKDLATINEKRSLLQSLGLYVGDENVIEDLATQDVKTDIMLELAVPVAHGLSDADVLKVFPKVYDILFPPH